MTAAVRNRPSWLRFASPSQSPSGKTKVWHVLTADGMTLLGDVRWFAAWRKYAFFPEARTVFEQDCLREIATFCEEQTAEHKRKRAA